jgi:hypothetical protein
VKQPVFVIGPARCGTSLLCHAIKKVGGYEGLAEGHVFDLIAPIMKAVGRHYVRFKSVADRPTQMISRFPRSRMEELVLQNFRPMAGEVFGAKPWLDKTPGPAMILSAPYILRIWPDAFFIFAHRRGIENVLSQQRKFPDRTFEFGCKYWADCMSAWSQVHGQLGHAYYMIDQVDLEESPERVARKVAAHLHLPAGCAETIAQIFTRARPENTGGRDRGRLALASCGWTREQQQTFLDVCGNVSAAFGYTTDESYRTVAAPA